MVEHCRHDAETSAELTRQEKLERETEHQSAFFKEAAYEYCEAKFDDFNKYILLSIALEHMAPDLGIDHDAGQHCYDAFLATVDDIIAGIDL